MGGAQRGQVLAGRSSTRAERPARVGDPAHARRDPAGRAGRATSTSRALDQLFFAGLVARRRRRSRARAIAGRDPGGDRRRDAGRRPRAAARLRDPHGPWGDALRREPGRPHARRRSRRSRTASTWARSRRASTRCCARRRARSSWRRPTSRPTSPRLARAARAPRRRARAREPAPRALEQLVDAQRAVARDGRERCTLLMHPDDAARAGARRRRAARASARRPGSVVAPVEVSDEMMPGVVCLPHGWGHDKPGTRLVGRVARTRASATTCSRRASWSTCPSGNAVVNGIPVEVAPARLASRLSGQEPSVERCSQCRFDLRRHHGRHPRGRRDRRLPRVPRPGWRDEFDAWRGAYRNPSKKHLGSKKTKSWDSASAAPISSSDGVVAEVIFPNTVPPVLRQGLPRLAAARARRSTSAGRRASARTTAGSPTSARRSRERRAGIGLIHLNDVDAAIEDVRVDREARAEGRRAAAAALALRRAPRAAHLAALRPALGRDPGPRPRDQPALGPGLAALRHATRAPMRSGCSRCPSSCSAASAS